MKRAAFIIGVCAVPFVTAAFAAWNINPAEWGAFSRFMVAAVTGILLMCFAGS